MSGEDSFNVDKDELESLIEQKVEEKLKNSREHGKDNSNLISKSISRREFLKKVGLGTAGLAALISPVSALDVRSDSFSVQTSNDNGSTLTEGLFVDENQNVSIPNGNLDVNSNNLLNVEQINGERVEDLGGLKAESSFSDPNENQIWVPDDEYIVNELSERVGWRYKGHSGIVWAVALGPDNQYLYSGSSDNEVHQINIDDGSQGWTYTGHSDTVWAVAVGRDNEYVYSGSFDYELHQINVSDGSQSWTYTGHSDDVWAVAVGPDNEYVYSGSSDDEVHQIRLDGAVEEYYIVDRYTMYVWNGERWV